MEGREKDGFERETKRMSGRGIERQEKGMGEGNERERKRKDLKGKRKGCLQGEEREARIWEKKRREEKLTN